MSSFDSPLEALAFEYASFGVFAVVNNLWTWIAVVTAAVSFWRIRVTSSGGDDNECVLLDELLSSRSEQHESCHLNPQSMSAPVEETVARVKETEAWEALLCDGVTKGKLTMYYYDVDFTGEMCVDGELTSVNEGGLGNYGEYWERVVKMRNGDDGWYRHVDLTVINGNVVRLWDDNNGILGV